jgi:hypothetical protein
MNIHHARLQLKEQFQSGASLSKPEFIRPRHCKPAQARLFDYVDITRSTDVQARS